ncbi:hypothetical protein [Williamsia sp. CHRR-6]|uniref:hypothetical protein n=1 Tax=Williamsia sp. CHRR-6 TaxID=2835871 RepID=UPI001BDA48A7|nr:hypothetical protein [Williamsia sp. CHRR-6]MBT0568171.1 hypothetical protein [Williamsia sp. CHRR-6]
MAEAIWWVTVVRFDDRGPLVERLIGVISWCGQPAGPAHRRKLRHDVGLAEVRWRGQQTQEHLVLTS